MSGKVIEVADDPVRRRGFMGDARRQWLLETTLVILGVILVLVWPISIVWPSGWVWGGGYSHYFPMILGLYATLGLFLILAARNPAEHRSLIAFTAWSSLVHAGIMAGRALQDSAERGHLIGDVPALLLVFLVLLLLSRRRAAG
jgi:hydrogenase-4 membrane subunit HyfE